MKDKRTVSHDHPTHGETLMLGEVAGITLSETAYHPGLNIPSHTHENEAYFNLVLQGGFREFSGKRVYELGKSALIFHSPGEVRANQFHNERTRLFNMRFDARWLSRIPENATILNTSTRFNGGPLIKLAVKVYREFREMDAVSSLVIEGTALEMVAEAARCSRETSGPRPPRWLSQARDMLHAHWNESLTLTRIAESIGVHPVHLSRTFRQHFRCTVGEYVRRLRVESACRKLSTSHASLVEIASDTGFCDQSHFSITFKRLTGLTPAQYREAFKSR
jgi:AraC family transcriptional regulator